MDQESACIVTLSMLSVEINISVWIQAVSLESIPKGPSMLRAKQLEL